MGLALGCLTEGRSIYCLFVETLNIKMIEDAFCHKSCQGYLVGTILFAAKRDRLGEDGTSHILLCSVTVVLVLIICMLRVLSKHVMGNTTILRLKDRESNPIA